MSIQDAATDLLKHLETIEAGLKHADRRLEAAQRLADALNRLAASHKDFLWCASQTPPRVPDLEWSQEIEDAARAALAEWKEANK